VAIIIAPNTTEPLEKTTISKNKIKNIYNLHALSENWPFSFYRFVDIRIISIDKSNTFQLK